MFYLQAMKNILIYKSKYQEFLLKNTFSDSHFQLSLKSLETGT